MSSSGLWVVIERVSDPPGRGSNYGPDDDVVDVYGPFQSNGEATAAMRRLIEAFPESSLDLGVYGLRGLPKAAEKAAKVVEGRAKHDLAIRAKEAKVALQEAEAANLRSKAVWRDRVEDRLGSLIDRVGEIVDALERSSKTGGAKA